MVLKTISIYDKPYAVDFLSVNLEIRGIGMTTLFGASSWRGAVIALSLASINAYAALSVTNSFSPNLIQTNETTQLTITAINNSTAAAITGLAIADTLPAGLVAQSLVSNSCGGTVNLGPPIQLSGGTVPAAPNLSLNGQCSVVVIVKGTTNGSFTNTIFGVNVTNTEGFTTNDSSASLLVQPFTPVTISKSFNPAAIATGDTTTVWLRFGNSNVTALTNFVLTDNLPVGLQVVAGSVTNNNCGVATSTPTTSQFVIGPSTLPASSNCELFFTVTGNAAGSYINTVSPSDISNDQNVTSAAAANGFLTVNPPGLKLSKTASLAVPAGRPAGTVQMTLGLQNTSGQNLTGVQLIDDSIPSYITLETSAPVAPTSTCGGTVALEADPLHPGMQRIRLSGGTLASGASCTVTVYAVFQTCQQWLNIINSGTVVTDQGITNANSVSVDMGIYNNLPRVIFTPTFTPAILSENDVSQLRFTVQNESTSVLTAASFSDILPTNLKIAAIPGLSTTCGGSPTLTAVAGGTSVSASGLSVPAGAGSANPAYCYVYVNVVATPPAYNDTGFDQDAAETTSSGNPAVCSRAQQGSYAVRHALTVQKSFYPATVGVGGVSTVSVVVKNNSATQPLTNLSLSDVFPLTGPTPDFVIANVPAASVSCANPTCPTATLTAVAGGSQVTLSGATIGPGGIASLKFDIKVQKTGTLTNVIPVANVTTANGLTPAADAIATIFVDPSNAPSVTKSFTPSTVNPGEISRLEITIATPTIGNHYSFIDTLPAGMLIAPTPNITYPTFQQQGTSVVASPLGNTITVTRVFPLLTRLITIGVDVIGTRGGTLTNTIPAGALTSVDGTNTAPASASLQTLDKLGIVKIFDPTQVSVGASSRLRIQVINAFPLAKAGVTVLDVLPVGLTLAATPNPSTTCLDAAAAPAPVDVSNPLQLKATNIDLAPNTTCEIGVDVVSAMVGTYVNTIPIGAVTATTGETNANAPQATLVVADGPTVTKQFVPAIIEPGQSSTLTITIGSTSPAIFGMIGATLVDTLPAGLTVKVGSTPTTTCVQGTVRVDITRSILTVGAVSPVFFYSGFWLGPTLSGFPTCTVTAQVTATSAGSYVNVIPIGGLTGTNFAGGLPVQNIAPAQATLDVVTSSIAGTVYQDSNQSGTLDAGDTGIAGVTVKLTGTDSNGMAVTASAVTDANGKYIFAGILSGTYIVTETQPAGYDDGADSAGTFGGTVGNDVISGITVPVGAAGTQYNFGELGLVSFSGRVYREGSNPANTTYDGNATDPGIAGVSLALSCMPAYGGTTPVVTAADGSYTFLNVQAGAVCQVIETQPVNFANAYQSNGTSTGGTPSNTGTTIVGIVVPAGGSTGNDFAEILGAVSGKVYNQTTNAGLGGQTINLTGVAADGTAVNLSTTTVSAATPAGTLCAGQPALAIGDYYFCNVPAANAAGYLISEPLQPAGTTNGSTTAGTSGGTASNPTTTSSQIAGAALAAGATSSGNNFGELGLPNVSGRAYSEQSNPSNVMDDGNVTDPGIGGVSIAISCSPAYTGTSPVLTAADGAYTFANVPPGAVCTLTEIQPTGYFNAYNTRGNGATADSGGATGGSGNSTITLTVPASGSLGNNFAEQRADMISETVCTPANPAFGTIVTCVVTCRNAGPGTAVNPFCSVTNLASLPNSPSQTCTSSAALPVSGSLSCTVMFTVPSSNVPIQVIGGTGADDDTNGGAVATSGNNPSPATVTPNAQTADVITPVPLLDGWLLGLLGLLMAGAALRWRRAR